MCGENQVFNVVVHVGHKPSANS